MYRIGQFSVMTKVTVKALRFYEDEGLLYPVHVDPATGYRYYDTAQLLRVHKIVSLKQCGFPLCEIRKMLDGCDVAPLLASQKKRLENRIAAQTAQLASINSYMSFLQEEKTVPYQVVVKELPRVTVYSCRMVVPSYDAYFDVIPEIGREIEAANPGLTCKTDPFYCFIMYHDGEYRSRDIDMEYCEAVTCKGTDTPRIKFKEIERVPRAACVLHKGPYATLPQAYCAVFKWIEDNRLTCAGLTRESYIDGVWNRQNPDEWLTEIQVPIG
ncbi:transcriptional regulator, MerR family [Treponema brennaborense DSM 12168]|uniref:Transcriptional regulator, MerR family n=1 Tax=Treponema brennaborense (strain DSM 12168 / CIP 105900 / DD5/3) TaxID=906968 RepID=F4LNC0_TREBD|nr:transcriptional regulator, MerR family [Treponema brennaborense DSM 12168]